MTEDFSEPINEFNSQIKEASIFTCITRDSDLQHNTARRLIIFLEKLKSWKKNAIEERNEDRANLILGMECIIRSFIAELQMWLELKKEQPDNAWTHLVEAQLQIAHAIRAHKTLNSIVVRANYYDAIERLVFPPQVFVSAGLIVKKQICTICNADYEECAHVVGLPYWGEFCFRRLTETSADHVAIVTDPANKLCRMTHFAVEGGVRNRMTWRIEEKSKGNFQNEENGKNALAVNCILLSEKDVSQSI